MRRYAMVPTAVALLAMGPLLPRQTSAESNSFGPYELSSIEHLLNELNYEMTHDVGSIGSKIRQFAERLPRVILPASLGAVLEGTDEAFRLGIDKKFLLKFGTSLGDVDLELVMTSDEVERFVESVTTETMLDAIGDSGFLFKPKNFKAKVAIDYLRHEMDLDIDMDERCQPKGIERILVRMASKGLALLLRWRM